MGFRACDPRTGRFSAAKPRMGLQWPVFCHHLLAVLAQPQSGPAREAVEGKDGLRWARLEDRAKPVRCPPGRVTRAPPSFTTGRLQKGKALRRPGPTYLSLLPWLTVLALYGRLPQNGKPASPRRAAGAFNSGFRGGGPRSVQLLAGLGPPESFVLACSVSSLRVRPGDRPAPGKRGTAHGPLSPARAA